MISAEPTVSVLKLPEAARDWDLVAAFMRLRKQVFVDEKDWPLHHADGAEFEQYDGLDTVYVIAHRQREVLGGARLKRTDCAFGNGKVVYSYMIRDACRGLLPGMPAELCFGTPPVGSDVWELTRLATRPEPGVAEAILRASNDYLFSVEATRCLFLGPPAFLRMARRLGWTPEPMGALVENRDGRFLAFQCGIVPPLPDASAARATVAIH